MARSVSCVAPRGSLPGTNGWRTAPHGALRCCSLLFAVHPPKRLPLNAIRTPAINRSHENATPPPPAMRVLVIVAKYFGVPVRGIRLFVFGGVAELGGEPRKPIHEILIALGGPVVTVLLIVLYILGFSLILTWSPVNSTLTDGRLALQGGTLLAGGGAAILFYLAMINTFVLLFNMIPAFPLDGGRVLRGIVWSVSGSFLTSTRIAGSVGIAFSWL